MRVGRLAHPFWLMVVLVAVLGLPAGWAQAQTSHRALAAFDPKEVVVAGGHQLRLSGPLGCDQGVAVQVRLAVTQRQSAAAAVDQQWNDVCTGDALQQWMKDVDALEGTTFAPGDALACGVAVFRGPDGTITDVSQWCDSVVLVPEGQG